jgi:hypothetical protein
MQTLKAGAAALFASISLTACSMVGEDAVPSAPAAASGPRSESPWPQPLSSDAEYVGAYTVDGNRIAMVTPGDTAAWCDGAERKLNEIPPSTDDLEFRLDGNRLTVYNSPEAETEGGPVVQVVWEADRAGGLGEGLEGHWRIRGFDYRVVSGALDAAGKAAWDARVEAMRQGNALGASEIELRSGQAYSRSDIRWADLFLADWNGGLEAPAAGSAPADRDAFDIEVRRIDRHSAELIGRLTGEKVRVAFAADGTRSYSSDRPDRAPYGDGQEPVSCPEEAGFRWFEAFKAENVRG